MSLLRSPGRTAEHVSDTVARYLVRELGDGRANDAEIVYERMRVIAGNVSTVAFLVVASRLIGAPALELIGVAILFGGLVVAKLLESDRIDQITKCRHYVWALMGMAVPMKLAIAWSTSTSSAGLPNLLGTELGPIAQNLGRTILPVTLVVGLVFVPITYFRDITQAWKMADSREDTFTKTSRISRNRTGRRF